MQLTRNFDCFVTKDNSHFAIRNLINGSRDGGYQLGEVAYFEDEGIKYQVTLRATQKQDSYNIDLRRA